MSAVAKQFIVDTPTLYYGDIDLSNPDTWAETLKGKEETIDKNIETLGTVFTSAIDSGVKSKLGTSSYVPPNDDATNALDAQIASAMGVK